MNAVLAPRTTLLGLASRAVPFLAGLAFYDRDGTLAVDIFLFKSVMIVLGAAAGAALLLAAFRFVPARAGTGLALRPCWMGRNMALDRAVLVAAMGMGAGDWFAGIGLRYLVIPIIAAAMGALAQRAAGGDRP